MSWSRERLEEVARQRLGDARLVVVANREPYIHQFDGEQVRCLRPASGVTAALGPVMCATGGTWVAHGSGDADRQVAGDSGRIAVPPECPRYLLRRLWLTPEEEEGYYYGFANGTLWPLCHQAFVRPKFDGGDWACYRAVNRRFAEAVLEELDDGPGVVFVQDYHFALLPRILKQARPDLVVAQFWHIPWPGREVFQVCPWHEELLDGLLGNDLLAFHVQEHCNNFLETADRSIESRVDPAHFSVTRGGRTTLVRPYPISVDPELADEVLPADWPRQARELRRRLGVGNRPLLVGVDRLDYIKGIPERLKAVDRLLECAPLLRGRFCFVQIGAPSRTHLASYQALRDEVAALAASINARHGMDGWRPVVLVEEHYGPQEIALLYRSAAVCAVTSLHDGMNLVAKEFVATRSDLRGVLVLSPFAGAARELTGALMANPFDTDALADAFQSALSMPPEEQRRRMATMRAQVSDHNIFRWAGRLLTDASRLLEGRPRVPKPHGPGLPIWSQPFAPGAV